MHLSPFVWFLVRLAAATLLGLAIGCEREFRGRPGGLHTTGLVAAGAASFAGIGSATGEHVIPYIVTGVGFLAGGVIFRQGLTISGINSAATIWATAAAGALAGVGLFQEALAVTTAIILVNVLADLISKAARARIERRRSEGQQQSPDADQ
jgi:putative Mg2+ transporter-C (MgtC) family protein